MKLYFYPRTRAVRVRWLLEELGVPYELERVDVPSRGQKSPEYLKIHPLGHVPALVDGELTMFESSAIVAYLADKYPERRLAPPVGSPLRGTYYQWMFYAMAELEPVVADIAHHTVMWSEDRRVPAVAEVRRKEFPEVVKALDAPLAHHPFILGEEFSAADVVVGGVVGWAFVTGLLKDYPTLSAYSKRLADRPAYRRARAD